VGSQPLARWIYPDGRQTGDKFQSPTGRMTFNSSLIDMVANEIR
jgi:hypothetical protein